jgi:hypothetical protein
MTGLLLGGAAVLVPDGLQAAPGGLGADLASEAARTTPLAAPWHAVTEGEVSA